MTLVAPDDRVTSIISNRLNRRLKRSVIYVAVLLLVLVSLKTTVVDDTDWERLGSFSDILVSIGEFMHVDWSLVPNLWEPALETILVATLGTLLGVITCIPAIWFGALNISPFPPVTYPIARLAMTLSRSIHEIVWALFFVAAVGLGALAGVLAIAVRSVGFIAKMSAEAIEDLDPRPVEAIRAVGGNEFQSLCLRDPSAGSARDDQRHHIRMGDQHSPFIGARTRRRGWSRSGLLPPAQHIQPRRGHDRHSCNSRTHPVRRTGFIYRQKGTHLMAETVLTEQVKDLTPQSVPEWRRFKFPGSLYRYGGFLLALAFISFSIAYLNIPLDRFFNMFGRVGTLIADRYYPPDIMYVVDYDYLSSVFDTVKMAYLGALFGMMLAIPLGWFGAFNMTPSRRFVYPVARLVTMSARAVHETIWAILFVTILGFGMMAGVLALTMFCIGFAGKLFAEEIEGIDMGPVEAIRATGASELAVMVYGVFPQVRVAFTGIGIYTWDVAFRAATVVGFFGAGGMGWYLKRNVLQIETQRVAAILLSIIVLVLVSEAISAWARARVSKAS